MNGSNTMKSEDKYQYYWAMKKRRDNHKPLDWDKIVFWVIIMPSFVLFAICYALARVYTDM